jgi:hypothetical protein
MADVIPPSPDSQATMPLATLGHGEKEIMAIVARLAHFAPSQPENLGGTLPNSPVSATPHCRD